MFPSKVPSTKFGSFRFSSWYLAQLVVIALLVPVTLMMLSCGSGGSGRGGTVSPPAPEAQFSLSQTSYSFPTTTVGTTSSTVVITVSSTGNADLQVSSVTDSDLTDFPGTTNCVTAGSIAPGSSCNISVQFQPGTAGSLSSQVTVTTNAGTSTIALSGSGSAVQPVQVSVSPSSVSVATGGTQQFAATVTGSSNTAVSWSVNSLAGGNSTVGTISTAGLYTAPADAPNPSTVTITATSSADQTQSASAQVTIAAGAQKLAITSLSSASPIPLTPLYISTTGLDTTPSAAQVTVQFSNSLGFSLTEQAIRTEADGTVVVGVPVYADPNSGQTMQGTLSIVLTQGSQATVPTTVDIQDLPPLSSYGTQLGQISHAFLNFDAMMLAHQINELQAFQGLPGNSVDTSASQATLQKLLQSVIEARSDVDNVSLNNSLVISAGTLPDGATVQFDQQSLDMMDRILGLYLSELATTIQSGISASPAVASINRAGRISADRSASAPTFQLLRRFQFASPMALLLSRRSTALEPKRRAFSSSNSGLQSLLTVIQTTNNSSGIAEGLQSAMKSNQSPLDVSLAIGGGVSGLFGLANQAGVPGTGLASSGLGALVASTALLQNLGNELGDLAFIMYASGHSVDPSVEAEAQTDLNNNASKAWLNTAAAELNLFDFGTGNLYNSAYDQFGEAVANEVQDSFENNSTQIGLQSAELIVGLAQTAQDGGFNQVFSTAVNLAAETINPFTSVAEGFAEVVGQADVPNSGGEAAALSGIDLSSLGGDFFTTLADQNGNFDVIVPLQDPNFVYSSADVTIVDPLTPGSNLGSEGVSLSDLTTATALQVPTIQGSPCVDNDAGDPDSDDPDCD